MTTLQQPSPPIHLAAGNRLPCRSHRPLPSRECILDNTHIPDLPLLKAEDFLIASKIGHFAMVLDLLAVGADKEAKDQVRGEVDGGRRVVPR